MKTEVWVLKSLAAVFGIVFSPKSVWQKGRQYITWYAQKVDQGAYVQLPLSYIVDGTRHQKIHIIRMSLTS